MDRIVLLKRESELVQQQSDSNQSTPNRKPVNNSSLENERNLLRQELKELAQSNQKQNEFHRQRIQALQDQVEMIH